MKKLCFALTILCACPIAAQTVVQQTSTVSFTPSTDHTVIVGGVAVLTGYRVDVTPQGMTAIVFSRDLGKPPPDINNMIIVPMGWTATQFTALGSGVYTASVLAIGPGGTSAGVVSDPFVRVGSPAAPGKAVVSR